MMIRHLTVAATGLLAASSALAHEGHGLPGLSHWHASDVFGLAMVAAAVAGVWWFSRRK